jgi:hypothetical protein
MTFLGGVSLDDSPVPIARKYQYVCSYTLPCGEATKCTCVPDLSR